MTDLDIWEEDKPKRRRGKSDGNTAVAFVTKLGAAKYALEIAQELPDITDLIDHAEAVRAAAKSLHISAEGINAWTRFIVDSERKGWAHIQAMREAGELAKKHQKVRGKKGRPTGVVDLKALIGHRPTQRASEWAALSKLTEHQLNELESIANEEDRVLTRSELMKLAKSSTPTSTRGEKVRSDEDIRVISLAQDKYASENLQIDDEAKIARTERGWWVGSWVWVADELAESDLEVD